MGVRTGEMDVLVRERDNNKGQESRHRIARISPVDICDVLDHETATYDESSSSSITGDGCKDGRKEHGNEEPKRTSYRSDTSFASVRNSSLKRRILWNRCIR